jgi:hypothetical protein
VSDGYERPSLLVPDEDDCRLGWHSVVVFLMSSDNRKSIYLIAERQPSGLIVSSMRYCETITEVRDWANVQVGKASQSRADIAALWRWHVYRVFRDKGTDPLTLSELQDLGLRPKRGW